VLRSNRLPVRKNLPHFPPVDRHNTAIILFVTVCTKQRKQVLANDATHQLLCAAWATQPSWLVGRDFWDTQLRKGENYDEKWQYVLENPVRAGLVKHSEDWPYQGELNVLEW